MKRASPRSRTWKTFTAAGIEQWRHWLAEHHDSGAEVWLVFPKRHTGLPSVSYAEALDEALCFGWIDSLVRRLDEARYARKFTPRKPDSRWSDTNRKRWAELAAAGRLRPAGLERAPTDRTYEPRPRMPSTVPRYIRDALRRRPAARDRFERLPPSERRRYLGWIHSARRPETKARRLEEAIRLLSMGRPLGLK